LNGERGTTSGAGSAGLSAGVATHRSGRTFEHDALLYADEQQFVAGALPFIQAGLAADAPVLVAVDRAKIALLKSALGRDADQVQFADMREIGTNPGRLIPVWKHFLDARKPAVERVWGIGEPVWAGRSDAELSECQRHESLLNLAFADRAPLSLLRPYDTASLDAGAIAGAHRSHPTVVESGARRPSLAYPGLDAVAAPFSDPLPEPRAPAHELTFEGEDLTAIRHFIGRRTRAAGLGPSRGEDFVLAVNEVATNSVRHGGGRGTLRAWRERDVLIVEVRDRGHLDDPLAGRRRPSGAQIGGYGLWLANQVCDLVQVRSHPDGCAVRVHMHVHSR
jgi:anti-sigma regulatory factor (Ser/Thr protein kinase)